MQKNFELRDANSLTSTTKKLSRCRSFHFRYLELCRAKNLTPLHDIRVKSNATSLLDFCGDKLSVNDWQLIVESLYYDQVLQTLAIRMRKTCGAVLDHLDTEKKARIFRQKPVLYTKFVFSGVVEALSNCIEFNKNLRILNLEGLPLSGQYIESIAKALSFNESIKEVSFRRSCILDKGCEAICNTIKYLENVEKLNLAECQLSTKGAEFVADMIKIQKISRYTEGWQKSLRYREVDPDSLAGIRTISLAGNELIGDDGVKAIVEVLKEDVWIKVLDMENCGLTDRAANLILDCLEINNYLIDFNVRGNVGISKFLQRSIRDQLGKDDDDLKASGDGQNQQLIGGADGGAANTAARKAKVNVPHLKEQLKTLEEQLAFERMLRKKAEQLNERLNQQIVAYENQMQGDSNNASIPEGYVVVKNESLQSIIRERNDFHKIANSTHNPTKYKLPSSPHVIINPIHKVHKQQNYEEDSLTPVNPMSSPTSPTTVTTTKAPTTMPTIKAAGGGKEMHQQQLRKVLKVRKVKSEVKYVDPNTDSSNSHNNNKNRESKSDHEFANESDFNLTTVQFETNIGDTIAKNNYHQNQQNVVIKHVNALERPEKKSNNNNNIIHNQKIYDIDESNYHNNNNSNNKSLLNFEMDDLSLSTNTSTISDGGDASSDSDTLRNTSDYQPMKVFIRRNKQQQKQHCSNYSQSDESDAGDGVGFGDGKILQKKTDNYYNGVGVGGCGGGGMQSPRTLFLGLCKD